jgi:hypothetical protein
MTNEELVRRYLEADARNDLDALESMRTADWEARWPATGELVTSSAAYRAIHADFPGGYPQFAPTRVIGLEDRYVLTPANTVIRVAGDGDTWLGESRLSYPGQGDWFILKLLELRDGKVRRETDYWSPVSEPPPWRSGLTERLPDERHAGG